MSDNSWYENGEFPPIGAKVLYQGKETEIVAYVYCGEHQRVVFQVLDRSVCGYTDAKFFEPIKTERELAIEAAAKVMSLHGIDTYSILAEKLFDAGLLRSKNES